MKIHLKNPQTGKATCSSRRNNVSTTTLAHFNKLHAEIQCSVCKGMLMAQDNIKPVPVDAVSFITYLEANFLPIGKGRWMSQHSADEEFTASAVIEAYKAHKLTPTNEN